MAATRLSNRKEKGFCRRLNGDFAAEEDYEETYTEDSDLVIGEEDVYEVEKLVEKRVIKVSHGSPCQVPALSHFV